ncbi:MAG: hypothetical protein AB7U63_09600 [Porticoccaceae bacterium]
MTGPPGPDHFPLVVVTSKRTAKTPLAVAGDGMAVGNAGRRAKTPQSLRLVTWPATCPRPNARIP